MDDSLKLHEKHKLQQKQNVKIASILKIMLLNYVKVLY